MILKDQLVTKKCWCDYLY